MRLSCLRAEHRGRLSALLVATGAFSSEEVGVALELFDATFNAGDESCRPERSPGPAFTSDRIADYEFRGASNDGDALLGYACFGPTPSSDGTYDLYWLAVDPEAQGCGVGRALVRDVEQLLVARQARLLAVETSSRESYARSREFYARCGYTEAARVRDFYAPADDRIILTTRLMARPVGVATR